MLWLGLLCTKHFVEHNADGLAICLFLRKCVCVFDVKKKTFDPDKLWIRESNTMVSHLWHLIALRIHPLLFYDTEGFVCVRPVDQSYYKTICVI